MIDIKTDKYDRLLYVIGMSFLIILIGSFLLTFFGIIDLRIVSEIEFNPIVEYIISFVMYMINIFFMFSISFFIFDKQIFYICLGYLPVCLFITLLPDNKTILCSTIIPCVYIIITGYMKYNNKLSNILLNLGEFLIALTIYQQISGYIKLHNFSFHFYKCNIMMAIIYSIDLFLFQSLVYKGVKIYAVENTFWRNRFQNIGKEILAARQIEDTSDLTIRQRRIFFLLAWGYLIAQSFFVIGTNVLINKLFHYLGAFYIGAIELIVAWIPLEFCRLALGKTFHVDKKVKHATLKCNIISFIAFFGISRFALPLRYSLFFNICVAAIIAVIIHILVIRNDEYKELFVFKDNITKFNLKTCTHEKLLERCRLKGFSKEDTEMSIEFFIDKTKIKELAIKYDREEQTLRNKKYKLSKQLNSII